MAESLLGWTTIIGGLVALGALAWSAFRYVQVRREEIRQARFENMQRLIKIFAGFDDRNSLALQLSAAFEFRFYPEYIELLEMLRDKHGFKVGIHSSDVQKELDNSIAAIRNRAIWPVRFRR